jgi:hypothetical protein
MDSELPLRLLGHKNGEFYVFDPRLEGVDCFDIASYTWGNEVPKYDPKIYGVDWEVTINSQRLEDLKKLMMEANLQYLWVDCVCINQTDEEEKAHEIPKMHFYYKRAQNCHILLDMAEIWNPLEIVDDLQFVGHILSHMGGTALASEAVGLTRNLINRLSEWSNKEWAFPMDKSMVRSTAVDMGVLNCYSTCVTRVMSLFRNFYFRRVWTFQEMILGKNVSLWAINPKGIVSIGEFDTWMDLATDSKDRAHKLYWWIDSCRYLRSGSIDAILRIIDEDKLILNSLQIQVRGISSARSDIINGGRSWWYENIKGVSNVFSAISLTRRQCRYKKDIFRGLLGIFHGLFAPEEVDTILSGDDVEKLSFNFFKQLSMKTGYAWTKLAISSKDRGERDWIPVVENYNGPLGTDCFAGVICLGRVSQKGQVKCEALTGLKGAPRKYMKILLHQGNRGHHFVFKGCNCGKKVKTGMFSRELIQTNDQPMNVVRDDTGRILVQCATVLGNILDPGSDIVRYRWRLLSMLQPNWTISDPNAKPRWWIDRCVSGTVWEKPDPETFRVHNWSMNYRFLDITGFESRLENDSTKNIWCEVQVNCGCRIEGPFSLIFEAIIAMEGSFLGNTAMYLDNDNRIILRDGLGLVQTGDMGRSFKLVAFGGDVNAYRSYASSCTSTKEHERVPFKLPWPTGRALVREEFVHDLTDMMRDYGYVSTDGAGNLLICRNHVMDQYKIIGVCIDENIFSEKKPHTVTIR